MNRKWFLLMVVGLVLALSGGAVQAYPELITGSTGIVQTPNAHVVGMATYDLAVDYGQISVPAIGRYDGWPIRLVAGLSDNVELGGADYKFRPKPAVVPSVKVTSFAGKVVVRDEDETWPAVAVGVQYWYLRGIGVPSANQRVWSGYLAGTKTLTRSEEGTQVTANLGVAYDSYNRTVGGVTTKAQFVAPFIGMEFAAGGGTVIAVDYKWQERKAGVDWQRALFGAVVRHPVSNDWTVELGTTNISGFSNGQRIFVGTCYRFGGGAPEE